MAYLDGTGLGYLLSKIKAAFVSKTDVVAVNTVDIDSTPTANSDNLVKSGGVKSYVDGAIPTVPTNVSAFTNDAGYLISHQDISGKQDFKTVEAGQSNPYTNPKAGDVLHFTENVLASGVSDVTAYNYYDKINLNGSHLCLKITDLNGIYFGDYGTVTITFDEYFTYIIGCNSSGLVICDSNSNPLQQLSYNESYLIKLTQNTLDTQVYITDNTTGNQSSIISSGGLGISIVYPEKTLQYDGHNWIDIKEVPISLSQLSDDSTHRLVTDTEKSTWNNQYTKPSGGIPSTDLASGVIPDISTDITTDATSDVKTVSPKAVKTFVENKGYTTNTGTVTGVTVGSTAYTPSSGIVTIPAYPSVPVTDVTVGGTSVVSNGTAAIPSIPNVPVTDVTVGGITVVSNGTAVIPAIPTVPTISTNIQTNKTSDTMTASPKAVYDEIHPATDSSQPVGGMLPNKLYKLGILTGNVTITFASPTDNTIENEYKFTFTSGIGLNLTWPQDSSSWKWAGNAIDNNLPNIEDGEYYEVSVLDGVGIINKFE